MREGSLPDTAVIMVTAMASTETAVEAMKLGAYDYITKPFKLDEVNPIIKNALERKQLRAENQYLRNSWRPSTASRTSSARAAAMVECSTPSARSRTARPPS